MTDLDTFIETAFEANFERLKAQHGATLTPDSKAAALEQVKLYWRRLRALAESVTETEIRLVLPEQQSPDGRRYTLEGIVDVVRECGTTTMYDLKTYLDADAAREHLDPHFRQLNVYAHIWQQLRSQPVDAVALVATRPPRALKHALSTRDARRIEAALADWEPIIAIEVNQQVVEQVMESFGEVVDAIEERRFQAPSVDVLRASARPGGRVPFGTSVCLNCDARFSCTSYRQFMLRSHGARRAEEVLDDYVADFGNDAERDEWLDANLDVNQSVTRGE